jgi:hypothetical protein
MLDARQDHRLGGAVDPADRAPVAVLHANPVLMAAQRPYCEMRRERVGGKSLDPEKSARWSCTGNAARSLAALGDTISRMQTSSLAAARRSTTIVAESDREPCPQLESPSSILAPADQVIK